MKFSVIIPSKDRKKILEQNLDRVAKAVNLKDLQLIVINDSAEELVLDSRFHFAIVYKNAYGGGVASARNYGASKAVHDWLIFMDDDMWVQPDTFEKLAPFCADPQCCLNVNWIYPEFLKQQLPYYPFLRYLKRYGFDSLQGWSSDVEWQHDKPFKVKGITSQFLLIHRDTFNKVGGYDVSFPFAGFEDHDMSKRLKTQGVNIYVDPQNLIYHNEADRLEIENWLERKKRGAITRRVGVSVGYKELELHYAFAKKAFYRSVYSIRKILLPVLHNWPKSSGLDPLFFFLVNVMLGTYSCIGYTSKQAQDFIDSLNLKRQKSG